MNWQDKIYESLTEVSLEYAAKAAGRSATAKPSLARSKKIVKDHPNKSAISGEELRAKEEHARKAKISSIKDRLTARAEKKHGKAGETHVLDPLFSVGAHYSETGGKMKPKRTLYSGGRRETRAQTVSRKFDKIASKQERKG
jgi:hypothetical protein